MRVGVLGTGNVGRGLATKLVELGHDVVVGGRSSGTPAAVEWAAATGERAGEGSFAEAAAHGELLICATAGAHSLEAVQEAGIGHLDGKVLVDVSNPLDFSQGFPPTLTVVNDDSVGEQLQRAFPRARVVKALNTVAVEVMVDPGAVPGDHVLFACGEDAAAKAEVVALLGTFGWPPERILDLGGIESARGMEMYLALWVRMMGAVGARQFNVAIQRA